MDELIRELYKYPINTRKHDEILSKIRVGLMDDDKMFDYNICFPSKFNNVETGEIANTLKTIKGLESVDTFDHFLFSNKKTFVEDTGNFEIKERYDLEYNLRFRQLTVGAYITDGDRLVLLKTKKGRLDGKTTLIQGHVDYTAECLTMSQSDILELNIKREIIEELDIRDDKIMSQVMNNVKPMYYMSSNSTLVSLEHFGIIYEITVDDINSHHFFSGEVDKHEVEIVPLDRSRLSPFVHFDDWTYEIYKELSY